MTQPHLVDNRDGNTLTKALNKHLKELNASDEQPDELCIASGYFNATGWMQIAPQVEKLPKVRLLLSAESIRSTEHSIPQPGDPKEPLRTEQQVKVQLNTQINSLRS